jgi:diamine N-acetyltransferase
MNIREAFPDDVPLLMDISHAVWEPTYRHIVRPDQIRVMMQDMHTHSAYLQQMREGHRFFIALQGSAIQGFVSFHPHADEPEVMRIAKLYVMMQQHGQGVGTALIAAVGAEALNQGKAWLELNVNRYNKALYFYRRKGFFIHRSEDLDYKGFPLNDYVVRQSLLT